MPLNKRFHHFAKFLSYVLGRHPYEFGLIPDENGYVSIKMLLKAVTEENEWKFIREAHFHELLAQVPEPPVEIMESFIRSVDRSRLLRPAVSAALPKLLFVCIRRKAHAHVLEKGISPSAFSQVVMSTDRDMALRMGRRFDPKPILLTVLSQKSREQGVVFFEAGGTLFTADHIPPMCFTGPAPAAEKEIRSPVSEPVQMADKTPGTFILDIQRGGPISSKSKGRKKEIPWKKDRKRQRNRMEIPE